MPATAASTRSSSAVETAAAVLRGADVAWPDRHDRVQFVEFTGAQGLQPLLWHRLTEARALDRCPADIRTALLNGARVAMLTEVRLERELRRVLAALGARSVPSVLMKGTALAYLEYPHPWLRPRLDTDVLIRQQDVAAVTGVMEALGYHRAVQTAGDLVMPQFTFLRDDTLGLVHAFDFHVKIANPVVFADRLTFEEVEARAVAVPGLGDGARALGRIDALLLACIHRVAHHHDSERLIWLYDIHLLVTRFDVPGFARFAGLATEKGLRAVCARGLALSQRWLGTPITEGMRAALQPDDAEEPTAAYLGREARRVEALMRDLKALHGWRLRLRLMRQHLCPPAGYMRQRYGVSSAVVLPALYLYRVVRGALLWLRRPAVI